MSVELDEQASEVLRLLQGGDIDGAQDLFRFDVGGGESILNAGTLLEEGGTVRKVAPAWYGAMHSALALHVGEDAHPGVTYRTQSQYFKAFDPERRLLLVAFHGRHIGGDDLFVKGQGNLQIPKAAIGEINFGAIRKTGVTVYEVNETPDDPTQPYVMVLPYLEATTEFKNLETVEGDVGIFQRKLLTPDKLRSSKIAALLLGGRPLAEAYAHNGKNVALQFFFEGRSMQGRAYSIEVGPQAISTGSYLGMNVARALLL